MEQITKKLKVIAKTGGIKVEGNENWINPVRDKKDLILENIETIKTWVGKEVVLDMDGKEFKGIGIYKAEQPEISKPESVSDEKPTEQIKPKETPKTAQKQTTETKDFKEIYIDEDNTNIYRKLSEIQTGLKVEKGRQNKFGNYAYRSGSDILEAVKPFLKALKLSLIINDEIVIIGDRYYVQATAELIDTETAGKVKSRAYARENAEKKGMDTAQVTGSTSSYARKYALNGLFSIDDTKDIDSMDN